MCLAIWQIAAAKYSGIQSQREKELNQVVAGAVLEREEFEAGFKLLNMHHLTRHPALLLLQQFLHLCLFLLQLPCVCVCRCGRRLVGAGTEYSA